MRQGDSLQACQGGGEITRQMNSILKAGNKARRIDSASLVGTREENIAKN
jgi:hypothetical protein